MSDRAETRRVDEQKLRKMFAKYDTDESGDIDTKELRSLFADLGVQKSESDIHSIMDKYASMQSPRKLSYIEFEKLFSISRLLDVFHQLDANRSGTVDGNELETAMHLLGYKLSRVQIGAMIRTIDSNGDKEITFDEFRDFFETAPLASLESIAAQWSNAVAESDCGSDFAAAPPIPGLHWWQTMIAGGLAGVAARTVTAPLEKVKIVAQTGQGLGQGMVAELVAIARSQEIRGLFAGNAINCIRVFPTGGITCTVYLNLLSLAPTSSSSGNVLSDPVYRLFCGGAAGLVANVLTYPMDLIRARVTVSTTPEKGLTELKKICSDVIHGGIYRGLRPTLMAVVPFVAVQNASIDVLKDRAIEAGFEASPPVLLAVGAAAGVIAQFVVYPLDVLRRQMQVNVSQLASGLQGKVSPNTNVVSDSTWLSMKSLVKTHGIRSLFAGIVPTFVKTIPTVAIVATVKGTLNAHYKEENKRSAL